MSDKQVRAQYTREFKQEAVRQVRSGQPIAVVAKVLGIPKASLGNWVRLSAKGELDGSALAMAWWRRRPPPGVIFHSDRGSQYCSHDVQSALKDWGMRSSMSRKGNCWDNAPTESFWGRLKTASVHGHKFATREQARQAVMDWMAFYNHRRLHSSLGYLSPMQYEQRWYEAQRKKAA